MSDVVIVDSGVANLASVRAAFARLGAEAAVTADPGIVRRAERLVLPGVGAFGAAAATLRARGLDDAVRDAAGGGTPLLAICLGLQLLAEESEESPGARGLGLIPGRATRLPEGVRVPHLGWNRVLVAPGSRLMVPGEAAFANSYALRDCPDGWTAAWCEHGERFVAALERGRMLACQFHPELSGAWGLQLLMRWLRAEPASADLPRQESRAPGLASRIIPCLDVKDGRVVKGVRFQGLRDAGDPAGRAAIYEEQGADEIVVLDVGASPEGRATQVETVRRVRAAISIPLTVGGGVRSVDDARALLSAGADKVSVNTAAARRPELLGEMAAELGTQCVVLAVDARRRDGAWEVLLAGGREAGGRDVVAWLREGEALGAGEILLTSWDQDGTRAGCDVALIRESRKAVQVPLIASGGVGTAEHAALALGAGADAVLAASILHDGDQSVGLLKGDLARAGFRVRPC